MIADPHKYHAFMKVLGDLRQLAEHLEEMPDGELSIETASRFPSISQRMCMLGAQVGVSEGVVHEMELITNKLREFTWKRIGSRERTRLRKEAKLRGTVIEFDEGDSNGAQE